MDYSPEQDLMRRLKLLSLLRKAAAVIREEKQNQNSSEQENDCEKTAR